MKGCVTLIRVKLRERSESITRKEGEKKKPKSFKGLLLTRFFASQASNYYILTKIIRGKNNN